MVKVGLYINKKQKVTRGARRSVRSECTRGELAELFAVLSGSGFLNSGENTAAIYGEHFHEVCDKGHWVEVLASMYKMQGVVDYEKGEVLASP